jgi:hypothetical protein
MDVASVPFRVEEGRAGQSAAGQMPMDGRDRGYGRARVNKPGVPGRGGVVSALPAASGVLRVPQRLVPIRGVLGWAERTGLGCLLLAPLAGEAVRVGVHAYRPAPGRDVCPACVPVHDRGPLRGSETAPDSPHPPAILGTLERVKCSGPPAKGPRRAGGRAAQRRGGIIFVLAAPQSVLFRPSARPRPSRSAGTFPLAWPGMNQPRCAARLRHVIGGGRALRC